MPRYGKITVWEKMFSGMATIRSRMVRATCDQSECDEFLARYKGNVLLYLHWLLPQYDDVGRQQDFPEISAKIWHQVMEALPTKLTPSWIKKNKAFRALLQDAVHEAAHACSQRKLAVVDRANTDAEAEESDLDPLRSAMLARARARLEIFQRTHAKDHCKYFTVFSVWDADHEQSYQEMKARLDPIRGCNMPSNTLAKTLERARAKFGRYLGEDVGSWLAETGPVDAVRYYDAFSNLDLLGYAFWSPYCLDVMGIDQNFLKQTIN